MKTAVSILSTILVLVAVFLIVAVFFFDFNADLPRPAGALAGPRIGGLVQIKIQPGWGWLAVWQAAGGRPSDFFSFPDLVRKWKGMILALPENQGKLGPGGTPWAGYTISAFRIVYPVN